jgi:hypothetical protein
LQRQHDIRCRPRLAPGGGGNGQHGPDALDALVDGLARAAGRLDRHGLEVVAFDQPVFILHAVDLEDLAAKPNHKRGAEIGMRRVTPLRAAQDIPALAISRHAAAGAVHESHGAIDLRIIVENAGAVDFLGDELGRRRGAIHRRENADVIARTDFAVRPHVPLKRRAQFHRQHFVVLGAFGVPIVARKIMKSDVVFVHPLAGLDRLGSKADDLTIFANRIAFANRGDRHLMAARHAFARRDVGGLRAGRDLIHRDDNIIVGRKPYGAGRIHPMVLAGGERNAIGSRRLPLSVIVIRSNGKPAARTNAARFPMLAKCFRARLRLLAKSANAP